VVKVSVIVPTYNYARFIDACLESIFAQRYRNFEVIVVDDGSTDGTKEAIGKYRESIVYIYQENRGLPAARNTGIRAARGEFLAFLDSDDLWLPDKLEEQLNVMSRSQRMGIIFSDASAFDGEKMLRESILKEEKICTGSCFRRLFMGNYLVMPTVVIRKACLEKSGLFDESLMVTADYDLWLRISAHYEIGFVDKVLALYRVHPSNMSKDFCRLLEDEIQTVQKIVKLYPDRVREFGRDLHDRLSSLFDQCGLEWIKRGRVDRAKSYFLKAIIEDPFQPRSYYYLLATMAGKRGFEMLRKFNRSWLRLNE
jgi:glycosyltransferase involved in cell wall biosynthesis